MIAPLMLLAGLALLLSQKKRAPSPSASVLEQEAARIVRESREIIDGKRDSYSDPPEEP